MTVISINKTYKHRSNVSIKQLYSYNQIFLPRDFSMDNGGRKQNFYAVFLHLRISWKLWKKKEELISHKFFTNFGIRNAFSNFTLDDWSWGSSKFHRRLWVVHLRVVRVAPWLKFSLYLFIIYFFLMRDWRGSIFLDGGGQKFSILFPKYIMLKSSCQLLDPVRFR